MAMLNNMYAIYGNIYHQYTPSVSIYTIHGDPMGYRYHLPICRQALRASPWAPAATRIEAWPRGCHRVPWCGTRGVR